MKFTKKLFLIVLLIAAVLTLCVGCTSSGNDTPTSGEEGDDTFEPETTTIPTPEPSAELSWYTGIDSDVKLAFLAANNLRYDFHDWVDTIETNQKRGYTFTKLETVANVDNLFDRIHLNGNDNKMVNAVIASFADIANIIPKVYGIGGKLNLAAAWKYVDDTGSEQYFGLVIRKNYQESHKLENQFWQFIPEEQIVGDKNEIRQLLDSVRNNKKDDIDDLLINFKPPEPLKIIDIPLDIILEYDEKNPPEERKEYIHLNSSSILRITDYDVETNVYYEWYERVGNDSHLRAHGERFPLDTSAEGEFTFYIVATDKETGTSVTGADITVIVSPMPNINPPSFHIEADGGELQEPMPDGSKDGESSITYHWICYENDPLTLRVEASIENNEVISYQWYDLNDSPIPDAVSSELSIDTSAVGELNFYVIITVGNSGPLKGNIKVTVRESIKPPEVPNIEIKRSAESVSEHDPEVILTAETQLDQLADDGIVRLEYQWYDADGNPILNAANKEFSVSTDKAGIFSFSVKVTNNDLRANIEPKEANATEETMVIVNQRGTGSPYITVNFAEDSTVLADDQIQLIENFLQENEEIKKANRIVGVQVSSWNSRENLLPAYDRRTAVDNAVRSVLGDKSNLVRAHVGWQGTGSGSTVTIVVTIEY